MTEVKTVDIMSVKMKKEMENSVFVCTYNIYSIMLL